MKTQNPRILVGICGRQTEEFFLQRRIHYFDGYAANHKRNLWIQRFCHRFDGRTKAR